MASVPSILALGLVLLVINGERVALRREGNLIAYSDEAGHAFRFHSGHPFRNEAGHRSDLKPATCASFG